jgi:hypothetical protein
MYGRWRVQEGQQPTAPRTCRARRWRYQGIPKARVWVAVADGVQTDLEEFHDGVLKPLYHWHALIPFRGSLPVWDM